MTLRWLTAGESHGPALVGIIAGLPAGLGVDFDYINKHLAERQRGVGRSKRQKIEHDRATILSGVRHGITISSPIAVLIENKDHENWRDVMSPEKPVGSRDENEPCPPRPGHADLAGALKWGLDDSRNVLERASGRTTAITVALGAICRMFLAELGICIGSRIVAFGEVRLVEEVSSPTRAEIGPDEDSWLLEFGKLSDESRARMENAANEAREKGDTLGGVVQIIAIGVPPGLGSCALSDERLDSRLAAAVVGVPGIKAVEIGAGISQAGGSGRGAHDPFAVTDDPDHEPWYARTTNLAGGIEGGMTNGEPISLTAWMKPLATVNPPHDSIDLKTGVATKPGKTERSDVAAVESAACVIEGAVALELARAHREKFAGDTMREVTRAARPYVSDTDMRPG